MKKITFIALIAFIGTIACNSSDGEKNTDSTKSDVVSETSQNLVETTDKPIHLTKAMFIEQIMDYEKNPQEWVYKGDKPGLIDFYADWCRPCKITSPILEDLAKEYKGKIRIYKVNVDQEKELAGIFGVQSIPTFLFMPMEGNPTITSGIAQTPEQTKEMFRSQIDQILLNEKKQ